MKILFALMLAGFTILISCDPPYNDLFQIEAIKLKATLNNSNEVLHIGDTFKITLNLPDTLKSLTKSTYVNSLQQGFYYLKIQKIDTVTHLSTLVSENEYFATVGNIVRAEVNLNKTQPYAVTVNFKPTSKGVYYLEVVSQPGRIKVNDNYEAGLYVTFNVLDKHHTMLGAYGTSNFLAGIEQAEQNGFGTYGFRVN